MMMARPSRESDAKIHASAADLVRVRFAFGFGFGFAFGFGFGLGSV